jgi:hypothetical protein
MAWRIQTLRLVVLISVIGQIFQLLYTALWTFSHPFGHVFAQSELVLLGWLSLVAAAALGMGVLVYLARRTPVPFPLIAAEIVAAGGVVAQSAHGVSVMWYVPVPQVLIPGLLVGSVNMGAFPWLFLGPVPMIALVMWAHKRRLHDRSR